MRCITIEELELILDSDKTTSRQKEVAALLKDTISVKDTADILNIRGRTVYDILTAAKNRITEIDMAIDSDLTLSGVSTLYKIDEDTGEKSEVLQWVKTKQAADLDLFAITEYTKKLTSKIKPVKSAPPPTEFSCNDNLLVTYVNTDLHLGQYSWSKETGEDVNLETVYNNTLKATQILLDTTPLSEEALILDLGDTLHSSNDANRTKSGNELDVDTRHAKVFEMLVDMKIQMIDATLRKHNKVRYVIVAGNHSDLVPNYLIAMLKAYYKNDPRFTVDDSVTLHKYYRFDKVLLGFHHGHSTKMQRLPEVMVWDRKEDISETDYRYWLTGHVHKDSVLDSPIAKCESFRNNTPNDAWAAGAGYRGHKQTVAITYHKKYGEIARNTCPIKML